MDEIYFKQQNKLVNSFQNHKSNWEKIDREDILLNDLIIVHFYSDSQKNEYELYPKYGVVTNVDSKFDKIIITNNYNSYSASHGKIAYYSRGYDYTILRQKK